jgi:hypothetical protein
LKKTSLGPLRQGQRLDTSETKLCSSKEHKSPKHTRAPPDHMHAPPEQVPTLGTNRSYRFPKLARTFPAKPIRPIWYSRPHPQKPKMQKKMHKFPLDSSNRF